MPVFRLTSYRADRRGQRINVHYNHARSFVMKYHYFFKSAQPLYFFYQSPLTTSVPAPWMMDTRNAHTPLTNLYSSPDTIPLLLLLYYCTGSAVYKHTVVESRINGIMMRRGAHAGLLVPHRPLTSSPLHLANDSIHPFIAYTHPRLIRTFESTASRRRLGPPMRAPSTSRSLRARRCQGCSIDPAWEKREKHVQSEQLPNLKIVCNVCMYVCM